MCSRLSGSTDPKYIDTFAVLHDPVLLKDLIKDRQRSAARRP